MKQYQHLRSTAEKKQELSAVHALHDFSEQLTRNKALMQYAQENYPSTARNIQILVKEKEAKIQSIKENMTLGQEEDFKNTLKNYQQIRKLWEQDPNSQKKETQLTQYANEMMHNHALMEYAQYLYPSTAKNIYKLSKIHVQNLRQDRTKKHDHDIER